MNSWTLAGSIIGIGLQILLSVQIFTGKVKQNFASWILWATLEIIVAASIISQHGNFLLPASYSLGCMIIALSIIKSKNISWTWFETFIACLAIACMIVWSISNARIATIASTSAVLIAGIPLLIDCYKNPWDNPFFIYSSFLIANALATAGGKNWSVEERLYPASCTGFTILVVIFLARKFWLKHDIKSQCE